MTDHNRDKEGEKWEQVACTGPRIRWTPCKAGPRTWDDIPSWPVAVGGKALNWGAGLVGALQSQRVLLFRYWLLPSLVEQRGKSDENIILILCLEETGVTHGGYELEKEFLKVPACRPLLHCHLRSRPFPSCLGAQTSWR